MENVQITFLRYEGSKRRLLSYIKEYLQPPNLIPGRYIDPFVGGGHEGGLLPVELANGVASLSTYPSARILKMFAEDNFKTFI
ncbi:MAG: hypothetical protein SNJ68_07370 [Cyanobacteriota bacterium]